MTFTKKEMKILEKVAKEFEKAEENKKKRQYVKIQDIKNLTLEELYDLNGKFIEGTDIMINVSRRPVKGGKFEYTAVGYDFIEFLEKRVNEKEEEKGEMNMNIKDYINKIKKINNLKSELMLDNRYYLKLTDWTSNLRYSIFNMSDLETLENTYIDEVYNKLINDNLYLDKDFEICDTKFTLTIIEC